jgi:hypothetical protein
MASSIRPAWTGFSATLSDWCRSRFVPAHDRTVSLRRVAAELEREPAFHGPGIVAAMMQAGFEPTCGAGFRARWLSIAPGSSLEVGETLGRALRSCPSSDREVAAAARAAARGFFMGAAGWALWQRFLEEGHLHRVQLLGSRVTATPAPGEAFSRRVLQEVAVVAVKRGHLARLDARAVIFDGLGDEDRLPVAHHVARVARSHLRLAYAGRSAAPMRVNAQRGVAP